MWRGSGGEGAVGERRAESTSMPARRGRGQLGRNAATQQTPSGPAESSQIPDPQDGQQSKMVVLSTKFCGSLLRSNKS